MVDLGRSSEGTERAWSELAGCPVLRLESFRRSIEDTRATGEVLRAGNGVLLDSDGLDWWELTGLFVHEEIETALVLRRLVKHAQLAPVMFATRTAWPVNAIAHLAKAKVESLDASSACRSRLRHYVSAFRKLRLGQILDIAFDKYDGGYALRGALSASPPPPRESQVLIPSAYTNVSRKASGYARLLPEQKFLLIATRSSGLEFDPPSNVRAAKLAAYASGNSKTAGDVAALLGKWPSLVAKLTSIPELETLASLGILDRFPGWFRDGIRVREAWKRVLDRESIQAVLCGDDSNWYTRLPVVLARKQGIPTIDFHHGAFDGRFLMKSLPSDLYLAKTDAERDYLVSVCRLPPERIVLGVAPESVDGCRMSTKETHTGKIVYFSEPHEALGARADEVYRELLPALCRLAAEYGTSVVVKLHPFEGHHDRTELLTRVLLPEDRVRVEVMSGPLTTDLLHQTWFGLTLESSTVVDCSRAGVPCFLCEWLGTGHFGYVQQFARFGIGRLLRSANEIAQIPQRLRGTSGSRIPDSDTPKLTSTMLSGLLTQGCHAQPWRAR